jgi:cytochrome c oxidase assembly factor 2
MAPPHLHPRSRTTSSLFATTLVLSFLVVGLPHILPCPAPRVAFLDGEMIDEDGRRRRRQQRVAAEPPDGIVRFANLEGDTTSRPSAKRECPVPKPGGIVGELLGFKKIKPTQDRATERTIYEDK